MAAAAEPSTIGLMATWWTRCGARHRRAPGRDWARRGSAPAGRMSYGRRGAERIRPSGLIPVTSLLRAWLRSLEDDELRRAFADWVREVAQRFMPAGETLPPEMTLEDIEMTLVERVSEWPKQWARGGREQGMREGIERGIEQGLAHERALLRRMAASRFGADTAEHLSGVLAGIADPERLAEVGEWLVRCDTGDEFLAHVIPARSEGDRRDA